MSRLVIVGAGMAAARLVEVLVARGVAERMDITVLGDEQCAPYNRILLSAVLEGTHRPGALALRVPGWYAAHGIDLRLGARVVDLRRDGPRGSVELDDGSEVPYDRLVLATGSRPTLPPIRGLVGSDGQLHPKVHAFRSLADCAGLLGALDALNAPGPAPTESPRRAVVVGGGLLGVQVARALSIRGLETEIVEGGDHLLRSNLDARGGAVLQRSLGRLGTRVYTGARAVRLTDDGLRLDNGFVLETDLVVLTAGGRPATALARRAGLEVRRGIVVDDTLQTSAPHVYAVGDCAEPSSRHGLPLAGFVPPAWEQAEVLAARLAGDEVSYAGTRTVARLRATDLEVAVLGDPEHEPGEVVEVTNPLRGSHRKLVVRDGAVVAGALVGDLSHIGVIAKAFEHGTVLGTHEPGALVLPSRSAGSAVSPAPEPVLPDDAEICACAGVVAGRIRGCASLAQVRETTHATTGCGGCTAAVERLIAASETAPHPQTPLVKGCA